MKNISLAFTGFLLLSIANAQMDRNAKIIDTVDGRAFFFVEKAWASVQSALKPSQRDLSNYRFKVYESTSEVEVHFEGVKRIVRGTGSGRNKTVFDVILLMTKDGKVKKRIWAQ